LKLTSELVPSPDSATVKAKTPFKTPWRTIQIADKPGDLMVSDLILNLNESSQFKDDTTCCKPLKYIGIWWGYHLGKWSWEPGDKKREHGANTANSKIYIDFAAKHHIKGLLIEGWNPALTDTSFARTFSKSSGDYPMGLRDYTKGHPDFDLIEVARYAREKDVELMLLDETMGAVRNFEAQMEKAFKLYDSLGIHYIKAGHAWYIENKEHFHKDQWKIQYDMRVLQAASKYHINVIAHESNKDTGLRRRFPNYQSREAARGNEYNAWDKAMGNPPEHETIIPFTRGLAGPIDYTPGIFDLTFDKYKGPQRVNTTKAKQLSLYVVLYSPVTMAADLIENYENDPAFKFIEDVPITWDETKVLNAEIGEYVTVARRSGADWYLGSLTDENARELDVPLSFLEEGKKYKAEIYADSPKTDLKTNPGAIEISQMEVTKNTALKIKMAESGGVAVRIVPFSISE
jgi:alpha-glucosidase